MNLSAQRVFHPIGHQLVRLKSVDSTNNYAMASVHEGLATHGTVISAFEQTAGRGQRKRKWSSAPGQNITLSIVLEPVFLRPIEQFSLSACIAVACHEFLNKYAPMGWTIKWPNDLFWNDRKAGGILIESIIRGNHWLYAVAGIGINVNQVRFPVLSPRPVSLKQITGTTFDPEVLALSLCDLVEKKFCDLRTSGHEEILGQYNRVLFRAGSRVTLSKDGKIFETTVLGVTPLGQLLCSDKTQRIFEFGEVSWVL